MNEPYAEQYRRLYREHWWWRSREAIVLREIRRWHAPQAGDAVLDIGCGDALLFPQLTQFGTPYGVEPDGRTLSEELARDPRIAAQPFDDCYQPRMRFGLILALDVLEHLDDPAAALRHARSLLRDGGTLVVTVPAFCGLWTRHDDLNQHRTRYTVGTLQPLVEEAGFRVYHRRYLFQWVALAKLGVRAKEALLGADNRIPNVPWPPLNRVLTTLSLVEERCTRSLPLPFGSSLLLVARTVLPPGTAEPDGARGPNGP